ncbi:MAG: T9SS type A sorting domain-containing protein, partial [Bergeyella zoohelcum]|nr:T9SS type A sorting domain-containing protein [Bergeyella zoohelcum]
TEIVNIPDEKFKKKLVGNSAINTNGDGEITYGEARVYDGIILVGFSEIEDLTGIEAFVNIVRLECHNNKLTRLDVSKNVALKRLGCDNNQLKHLDVSQNTALTELSCFSNQLTILDVIKNVLLEELSCYNNQLTSLDVSKNVDLLGLGCYNNQLKELDVSQNTKLIGLGCYNNQLTRLDISKNVALRWVGSSNNQLTQLNLANGNNKAITYLDTTGNPELTCIQIDSNFTPSDTQWKKDTTASYSVNCNYPTLSSQETNTIEFLQILNPVRDNLIISTTAKIHKVEIYNAIGQLVKVLEKNNTQIQILTKGVYLAKIFTDSGIVTRKIVKE